ncbi:MAG: response regulator, partial [Proteobacteria bacterium]|nr:response regulator [Pseudomonadota bacterium]
MLPVPKILIVDDEPRMCDSLQILLSDQGYEVSTANSGYQAIEHLSKGIFDVVLMDIVMPGINGLQLMDYINNRVSDTLVIVITGHASLESAVGALRKGAYDYLKKPFEFDELLKTVQNALKQKKLKYENKILNGKLAMSETRYQSLVHNSPDIIYTLDEHGNFTFVNSAAERLLGYKSEDLVGKHYSAIIFEEDMEKAKCYFNERRTGDRATSGVEIRLKICGNGNQYAESEIRHLTIELKSTGMYDMSATVKNNGYIGTHGVARDISDRLQLESQLKQSQKMEALGTLAGGIAHDFNNLLMGIQGNAALMLLDMNPGHRYYKKIKNIEQCVKHGADLTSQLLGFARGGKYQVKPTDLNRLVQKTLDMFG